ncbi:MAG: exodeoxyribonuclease III [Gammaproteobacteria bacterium]|nr:exodeoxyribonuclease III [Gammaproteobacteria bacterium]
MRIISLRCNGLISAVKQGLTEWLLSKDADVICLQDVRVRGNKVIDDERFYPNGFSPFFFEGEDEGKGGVAIFTRHAPKAVMRGLGSYDLDRDGRYIQADFDSVSIVSILLPSPTSDERKIRDAFIKSLETWMRKVRKKRRHFIFCGDFGVAARTLDVEKWHQHHESPGFTKDDRHWLDSLLSGIGYADAFRQVFINEPAYSWFPEAEIFNMPNPGAWRTDLQLVSQEISSRVLAAGYVTKRLFDDRVPLVVDYDIKLGIDSDS